MLIENCDLQVTHTNPLKDTQSQVTIFPLSPPQPPAIEIEANSGKQCQASTQTVELVENTLISFVDTPCDNATTNINASKLCILPGVPLSTSWSSSSLDS